MSKQLRGRPHTFTEAIGQKIVALYKEGKTDREVAKLTGISKQTIYNWRNKFPELMDSIKESKDVADDLVEACLFARATGYNYTKVTKGISFTKEWELRTPTHVPPDVGAQIFWLKNRRPHLWRDVKMLELPPAFSTEKKVQKTFSEFCETAGYPKPYPKQIEMLSFGMTETVPRLLLGSRGYGKTDYITILGVAYDIYLNGHATSNLIISKSKVRNTAMIEEIASALIANGIELEKNNSNCVRVKGLIGKDNSAEVITIKTSMRGRHPKRVIMDDPVTDEDTSEATRLVVKKKYNETMKLCSNVCIIGQPAHKYDLYAELRSLVKTLELPHGTIPELDHDLEAQRLAGVDEASISASYYLKVLSEGTTPFDAVKYMDVFPTGDSAVAFIDPSFTGGDYTALSIIKSHMQGVAVCGFVYKKAWNHCLDEMIPQLQKFNVKKLAFETNSLGDMPLDMLRQAFGRSIGIMGRVSNSNKHARIMAAGSYAHLIHLSKESHKTYIDHVVQYEYKAKFDDAPDSLASCLEWIGLIRGKQ